MTLGNLNSTFTLKGEEMGTIYYVFLKFLPQYSFLHDAVQKNGHQKSIRK